MKYLLLTLILLVSDALFAQKRSKYTKGSDLQIGINFSPEIGYRFKKNDNVENAYDNSFQFGKNIETPRFEYSLGIDLQYSISDQLFLGLGVIYSRKGYGTKKSNFEGYIPGYTGEPEYIKYSNDYHYMGIPLKIIFCKNDKTLNFVASAGVEVNVLVDRLYKGTFYYINGKQYIQNSKTLDGYNFLNVTPFLTAGIKYAITEQINLLIEPIFRYSVVKLSHNRDHYLWTGGLNFGCYYKIG